MQLLPTHKENRGDEARDSEARSDSAAYDSTAVLVEAERHWPGSWTLVGVALLYVACIAIATYPRITLLGSRVPWLVDPCEHLWIMRWYKICLMEGRKPFFCPEIQYPVGAALGTFPPLLLQSLQYLILSQAINNDVLCYNIIWICAFLGTGLGTFLLCWFVVRDRASAALGGLLAMFSGPMMLHGLAHVDLISLGAFPLFLAAWIRFVDAPRPGRLLAAVGLYWLVVMSAAYFTVLATFPAAAYAAWHWVRSGRGSAWAWLRVRAPWFAMFAGLGLAGSLVLFASQLWCIRHGIPMHRSREEFETYNAQLWSYIAPTPMHLLGRLLPRDPYEATILKGSNLAESSSYLGLVTIGLLGYAAACRVRFRRASYWWLALGLLVVLSGGVAWTFGSVMVRLPCHWLWDYVFKHLLIRSPARFNLLAAVVSAVLASAGMRHLLDRFRSRAARAVACGMLGIIALVDLSTVPFGGRGEILPRLSACFEFIKGEDPKAAIVEVPQSYAGEGTPNNALCTYWQSLHRCRSTSGYSGVSNPTYDLDMVGPSPFAQMRLADPGYLAWPQAESFGPAAEVDFRDYVWLYLTVHQIRYVVVHAVHAAARPLYYSLNQSDEAVETSNLNRLRSLLECAKVFEDERAAVYDRERLEPPKRPVLLASAGWLTHPGHRISSIGTFGRLAVYNPDPDQELTFTLKAMPGPEPWPALLKKGEKVLARWEVLTDGFRTYTSPPIRLEGVQVLILEKDGEGRPSHDLLVSKISLDNPAAGVHRRR